MFKALNLTLRFILELILLLSLGYWGFHLDQGLLLKIAAGIGLPLAAAILWGMFISPKATLQLPLIGVLIIESFLFGLSVLSLIDLGFMMFAILFGCIAFLNRFIIIRWKQGI